MPTVAVKLEVSC